MTANERGEKRNNRYERSPKKERWRNSAMNFLRHKKTSAPISPPCRLIKLNFHRFNSNTMKLNKKAQNRLRRSWRHELAETIYFLISNGDETKRFSWFSPFHNKNGPHKRTQASTQTQQSHAQTQKVHFFMCPMRRMFFESIHDSLFGANRWHVIVVSLAISNRDWPNFHSGIISFQDKIKLVQYIDSTWRLWHMLCHAIKANWAIGRKRWLNASVLFTQRCSFHRLSNPKHTRKCW